MKAKWLPISAAVALALGSVSASAVDFHGYARSGLNYASDGGNAYCSGTGTSGYLVGRLGNECNTYVELGLSQEVFNKANNKFTVNTLTVWRTYEDNIDYQGNSWQAIGGNGGGWGGQQASLREIWSGYEMPSGMQIWAGKRYYQRKDIHIMDYYYLNNSGTGFGVENIDTGLGAVSVAIIKQQTTYDWTSGDSDGDKDRNSWKLDARWSGIPLWTDGSLDIAMIYAWQNLSESQKKDFTRKVPAPNTGYHLNEKTGKIEPNDTKIEHNKDRTANNGYLAMIEWTQGNFFGGFNKLSFTYGHDGLNAGVAGNHAGDNVVPYPEKGNSYRFIDWGVIEQPSWNLGYAVIWTHHNGFDENVTEGGVNWTNPTGNDFNIVLRPAYKWSDFTSTVLEFGYYNKSTNSKAKIGDDVIPGVINHGEHRKRATKLTLAQQWTPSSQFWARPSIRVFASWLSGNAFDHKFDDNNDSHQITLGAQVEAWW